MSTATAEKKEIKGVILLTGFEIAVVQATFELNHKSKNLVKMKDSILLAKKRHRNVRLILFPELCITGYFLDERLESAADSIFGEHYAIMSKIAAEQAIYLGYGYVERGPNQELFNSFIFINPEGECIGNYRKIHLTPLEKKFFTPGSELVVVPTELGNFGLMICWDLAFPEMARALALQGADIMLAPSAWELPYQDAFVLFGKARAIDNTVFLAACNHIGQSSNLQFFGESAVYGPAGNKLIDAASREEIMTYNIDLSERQSLKKSFFTMFEERRPDIYEKGALLYECNKSD